jgi:hypothetical protein
MELLLILTYTAICYAIFKAFKIPVNKWTVPTAALGGVFIIAGLVLLMSYNHPFTNEGRIYFTSAPVIPSIKGPVIEVPVTPNVPLKKVTYYSDLIRVPMNIQLKKSGQRLLKPSKTFCC